MTNKIARNLGQTEGRNSSSLYIRYVHSHSYYTHFTNEQISNFQENGILWNDNQKHYTPCFFFLCRRRWLVVSPSWWRRPHPLLLRSAFTLNRRVASWLRWPLQSGRTSTSSSSPGGAGLFLWCLGLIPKKQNWKKTSCILYFTSIRSALRADLCSIIEPYKLNQSLITINLCY